MALVLSLAVLLLVLLALLGLGLAGQGGPRDRGSLVAIQFRQADGEKQAKAVKAVAAREKVQTTPVNPPQVPPQPVPQPTKPPPDFIHLSREEFAASDIAAIGRRRAQQAEADAAQDRNGTFGPGGGPGGARLYAAQWYREPRDAELRPYLERGAPEGAWAVIACQTIANFHVENCQEMDEYPLGSGLARGLRRAAWQFLVWPPRVDGKPQVGTWVRIRFDFSRNAKRDD